MLDIEKIQRVGKLAGELLSSGMAKDSQDAMRRAEDMLLKNQETHLSSPFMMGPASTISEQPKKREEDYDYDVIVRKFTLLVEQQKKEMETLKGVVAQLQKEIQDVRHSTSRAAAPALMQPEPHSPLQSATSAPSVEYAPPAAPAGFGDGIAVSRSVPAPSAPTRRYVPIIGPDGKPVHVESHVAPGSGSARSGDYKPSDVSVEKFFYSGSKKR